MNSPVPDVRRTPHVKVDGLEAEPVKRAVSRSRAAVAACSCSGGSRWPRVPGSPGPNPRRGSDGVGMCWFESDSPGRQGLAHGSRRDESELLAESELVGDAMVLDDLAVEEALDGHL